MLLDLITARCPNAPVQATSDTLADLAVCALPVCNLGTTSVILSHALLLDPTRTHRHPARRSALAVASVATPGRAWAPVDYSGRKGWWDSYQEVRSELRAAPMARHLVQALKRLVEPRPRCPK